MPADLSPAPPDVCLTRSPAADPRPGRRPLPARGLGWAAGLPARGWTWCRRRPRVASGLVALAVVALAVGGWRYALHQWQAAQAALREDRAADARRHLDRCLLAWPRSPEVHLLAARAARLAADPAAAEGHLNQALRLHGGASEGVQLEFLLLRVQSGEVDEVAPVLIDAVENGNPQSPLVLETLARAYMLRLRYKPAWSCLAKWAELRPEEVKPFLWRAWVLERLNNHKGAMADYQRVLALDPDSVPARLRVAEMLLEDKQAPEAVPHLERLHARVPDDPYVQARLGFCRFLEGRLDEARGLMEAAAARLPKDPALAVALANLDVQEGRPAEAERRLRAFLADEPSDTEALFVLTSALRAQGRADEAAAALAEFERTSKVVDRANDLLTHTADSQTAGADDFAEIGQLLLTIGRDKLGTYWLGRALDKHPGHQAAHRALLGYHERKGDKAQADFHRRHLREPAR